MHPALKLKAIASWLQKISGTLYPAVLGAHGNTSDVFWGFFVFVFITN